MQYFLRGVILAGVLAGGMAGSVRAQDESDLEMELYFTEEELAPDEIESASKRRQSIFWSPSAISVITREDIHTSGGTTLIDLLRRVPGFDVYEIKPSYPIVGARALTEQANNLVLVLVDGQEILAELTGVTFWSALPFDLSDVERIEVIRGPGSALYGANAFAAVVNITTRTDLEGARVNLVVGEQGRTRLFGSGGTSLNLGSGVLSLRLGLGADRMNATSTPHDTLLEVDFRTNAAIHYRKGSDLSLSLSGGLVPGTGLFFTHIGDMWLLDALNYWAMFQSQHRLGKDLALKTQVYLNAYYGTFRSRTSFKAYGIWIADLPDFYLDAPTLDGQLQLDWRMLDSLQLIAGANIRYVYLYCDNYDPSVLEEFRGGLFLQANWSPADPVQITGGLRVDLSTEIEPAVSPRVAVVWRPASNHALRLSFGLAFRKPNLYESQVHPRIYDYNSATPEIVDTMLVQNGNEDLANEKVYSLEAGWRTSLWKERLEFSLDLFYSMYWDTIGYVIDVPTKMGLPNIAGATIRFENQNTDINAIGGESEIGLKLSPEWSLWCNAGLRWVTFKKTDTRLLEEPILRLNAGLRYSAPAGWFIDTALHYLSTYEPPAIDPGNPLEPPGRSSLGNTLLMLTRLGYRVPTGQRSYFESGITLRMPLGKPFREYPGTVFPPDFQPDHPADFGGEVLERLASFYLRAEL